MLRKSLVRDRKGISMAKSWDTALEKTLFDYVRWRTGGDSNATCINSLCDGVTLNLLAEAITGIKLTNWKRGAMPEKQRKENIKAVLRFLRDTDIDTMKLKEEHIQKQDPRCLQLVENLFKSDIRRKLADLPYIPDKCDAYEALKAWLNRQIEPQIQVNNLTDYLATGKPLAALVESFVPGTIPNWGEWSELKDHSVINIRTAMMAAVRIGVINWLQPEDMCADAANETRNALYLFQFVCLFPEASSPANPRNSNRFPFNQSIKSSGAEFGRHYPMDIPVYQPSGLPTHTHRIDPPYTGAQPSAHSWTEPSTVQPRNTRPPTADPDQYYTAVHEPGYPDTTPKKVPFKQSTKNKYAISPGTKTSTTGPQPIQRTVSEPLIREHRKAVLPNNTRHPTGREVQAHDRTQHPPRFPHVQEQVDSSDDEEVQEDPRLVRFRGVRNEDEFWKQLPSKERRNYTEKLGNFIEYGELKLVKKIPYGTTWDVYKARFRYDQSRGKKGFKTVAAKTLKDRAITLWDVLSTLEEARLMTDFTSDRVMSLVGVTFDEGLPVILMPLQDNGDLQTYLEVNAMSGLYDNILQRICSDVATGMEYLHEDVGVIHQNLSTRHCLVDVAQRVKIFDFSLTRETEGEDEVYVRVSNTLTKTAWRRMAPEIMGPADGVMAANFKTDVWSFGILMHSVYYYGDDLFPSIDSYRQLYQYFKEGKTVEPAQNMPSYMNNLSKQCMDMDPQKRPSFKKVVELIDVGDKLHARYEELRHSQMAIPYMNVPPGDTGTPV